MNALTFFPVRPSEAQFNWTGENVERLRALVGEEKSAAEISGILGATRNAVIGKVTRMGLQLRGGHGGWPRREPRHMPLAPVVRLRATLPAKRVGQGVRARSPKVEHYVEKPGPVALEGLMTIEDLNERVCKFPYGDPRDLEAFRYCGSPVDGSGRPYCAGHRRVMYAPRQR